MYEFSKTALLAQTIPASRAWNATRGFPNGYRVIQGVTVVTAVQKYTLKSAYHTVVDGEGWADGVQINGDPLGFRTHAAPRGCRQARYQALLAP